MAVVEFLISDFEKLCGFPKDKIIEGLTSIGAPCEEEPETKKLLVELTPNRPDWFALEGLARSLRAYYKKETKYYSAKKGDYVVLVDESVSKIRPYTACAVVKNLKFTDERIIDMVQVQEKLNATLGRRVKRFGMGIYPLHQISFPLRYTTMKPEEIRYMPLNYAHEAGAAEILEKHPKGQEYGHIIKNFGKWPVFLDANNEVMALIPIVNSAKTGQVDLSTKDVFIEVTGIDGSAISAALNIVATMFADMGGEIHSVEVRYPKRKVTTPDLEPKKMAIDAKKTSKILGVELSQKEISSLAARMGYDSRGSSVLVPPFRADVIHEVDVIEDIAIAYGYNKFEPTLPNFFSTGKKNTKNDATRRAMEGMGFLEITTFILTNKEKLSRVGFANAKEVENPAGMEYTCLRPTLLADLISTFEINKTKGIPQRFFEIGTVFSDDLEKTNLIFGVIDEKLEYSDVKGFLQTLMMERGETFELKKTDNSAFDSERAADVFVEGKRIGVFGRINKKVLEGFGLGFEAYACEISL